MAAVDTEQAVPVAESAEEVPGTVVDLTFKRSASFAQFAAALASAQGEMEGASKDSLNPHFKNRYADLAAVWDACRAPLSKNGIAVIQPPCAQGPTVTVTTLLAHRSGEWIQSDLTMTAAQNTPQGIGSCITYARRYALQSMVGIAPEDDDGNAASHGSNGGGQRRAEPMTPSELPAAKSGPAPAGFDDWWQDMKSAVNDGFASLDKAWAASKGEYKNHVQKHHRAEWAEMKVRAQAVAV